VIYRPAHYDTSTTTDTAPWATQFVASAANVVITGTIPTDMTAIPVSGSVAVCYSPSDAVFLELPRTSPRNPPHPAPAWRAKLQKVTPFFAPRPEFHARSNPSGR
jgi:hypothetical protein